VALKKVEKEAAAARMETEAALREAAAARKAVQVCFSLSPSLPLSLSL
jgi:hypothetical protein